MAYFAQAVANEFIELAGKGRLDPMKLQKLVYYAHGWFLAIQDEALVKQAFEAWQFGPVIPDLYQELKVYGAGPVTEFARRFSSTTQRRVIPRISFGDRHPKDAEAAVSIIRDVWGVYGDYTAIKLSNATHKKGTPWAQWYDPMRTHVVIPNEDIRAYFRSLQGQAEEPIGYAANT